MMPAMHASRRRPVQQQRQPLLFLLPCLLLLSLFPTPLQAAWWSSSSSSLADQALAANAVPIAKVEPVLLEWEGITCELTLKKKKDASGGGGAGKKKLLQQVTGTAKPGRLLAILGPSGSGKTTLLNVLAGQVPASPMLSVSGRLYVNGEPASSAGGGSSHHTQAYVRQQDLFYSQLTVRETLLMAARLRLPASLTLKEKYELVENLMKRMGLAKAADTIVGDEKVRGISGGEKKRLSLACELIGSPSLIFADEPTSGLDAFQSETILRSLKDLAQRGGHTVVISIHQPRSSIFNMFDDVVLMSDGEVVYAGPAGQSLTDYFASLGHPCPRNFNPAEHVLDLVSVDYTTKETEEASRARVGKLLSAHRTTIPGMIEAMQEKHRRSLKDGKALVASTSEHNKKRGLFTRIRRAGPFEQFRLLFKRSWRQITRSKGANIARAASNIFSAVVFGCIFFQMGNGQTSIQDRMGLLQVAAINAAMSSLIKTITVFIQERLIVTRERSNGKASSYGTGPYFLSKLAAELPVTALFPCLFGIVMYPLAGLQYNTSKFLKFLGILIVESYAAAGFGMAVGTMVPSVDAGLAIAPALMVIFIITGGLYVNQASVPRPLQWIQDVSLIKYAFEALCINEFSGLEFEADRTTRAPSVATGEQVLQRLNFHESTVGKAVARQGMLAGVSYLMTWFLLAWRKPKFETVVDPEVVAEKEGKKNKKNKKNGKGEKVVSGSSGEMKTPVVSAPSTLRL